MLTTNNMVVMLLSSRINEVTTMNPIKDDDILPGSPTDNVKGMTSMAHIHPCFKARKVLQYLGSLIIDYNYKHIDDLSLEEKAELVGILIEAGGKHAEHECITETDRFDLTIGSFKAFLKSDSIDNAYTLAATLRINAIKFYEEMMKDIFNFVFEDYHRERQEWLDYVSKQGDPDEARDRYLEQLYCV